MNIYIQLTLIVIIFYILPAFIFYRHTQLSHSENGIYEFMNPGLMDLLSCITPLINWIGIILWFVKYPVENKSLFYKLKIDYTKFFNIKTTTQ